MIFNVSFPSPSHVKDLVHFFFLLFSIFQIGSIKHLVPLLTKMDQESVDKLLNLESNSRPSSRGSSRGSSSSRRRSRPSSGIKRRSNKSTDGGDENEGEEIINLAPLSTSKSPIELYLEYRDKKRVDNSEAVDDSAPSKPSKCKPPASPKGKSSSPIVKKTRSNSTIDTSIRSNSTTIDTTAANADEFNGDIINLLSDAWMMNDSQENYIRGRESYGVSIDAVLIICLNQMLILRNLMLKQ
jgi:hypothetical protein